MGPFLSREFVTGPCTRSSRNVPHYYFKVTDASILSHILVKLLKGSRLTIKSVWASGVFDCYSDVETCLTPFGVLYRLYGRTETIVNGPGSPFFTVPCCVYYTMGWAAKKKGTRAKWESLLEKVETRGRRRVSQHGCRAASRFSDFRPKSVVLLSTG